MSAASVDAVVVGAGAGGGIVAAELAQAGCAWRFLIVAGISRRQTSTMTSSQPRRHRGIVMGDALARTSRKFNPIGRTRGLLPAKCLRAMVIFLLLAGALVGERSLIRAFRG